jgi:CRISPR-associated exonuclease Cas4
MSSDDQLLPISALQHLLYCPRQCALIHLERLWAENRFTVEGRHLHAKADKGRAEVRRDLRRGRAVPVWSCALGLFGVCDVVEFRAAVDPCQTTSSPQLATSNPQLATIPFPVEYKRGKPKSHDADKVQLCAQAMCLEEMLGTSVPAGALFYGKTRRRQEVIFDPALRELTRSTAVRLHELIGSGRTPAAVYEKKKCDRCSLKDLCLPRMPAGRAGRYLAGALAAAVAGPVGE